VDARCTKIDPDNVGHGLFGATMFIHQGTGNGRPSGAPA
jgi:hypothetical protein